MLYVGDLCLVVGCWLLSYFIRFYVLPTPNHVPPFNVYLHLSLLHLLIFSWLLPLMRLYKRPWADPGNNWWYLLKACGLGMLVGVGLTYFLRPYDFSRAVFLIYFCVLSASIIIYRPLLFRLWSFLGSSPAGEHTLIVGSGPMVTKLYHHIQDHPELGIRVVGFLSSEPGQNISGLPNLGGYAQLNSIIHEHKIASLIIVVPLTEYKDITTIIKPIEHEMVDIKIIPDFSDLAMLRWRMELLDDIPLINLRGNSLQGWPRVVKRMMDFTLSALALVVLLIPMLIIAILVKRSSPGPVIYRQLRMGLDGRLFYMLKFRTMGENAEQDTGPVWAESNDPRCTALGNKLRNSNLDELPQFWNVLKGEMSLVGPRPERPELIDKFKKNIPGYMLRHKVKAGITGWAQVNGWRGQTSLSKRIAYDLYYIENWSLKLDIIILWKTFWQTVFSRRNKADTT